MACFCYKIKSVNKWYSNHWIMKQALGMNIISVVRIYELDWNKFILHCQSIVGVVWFMLQWAIFLLVFIQHDKVMHVNFKKNFFLLLCTLILCDWLMLMYSYSVFDWTLSGYCVSPLTLWYGVAIYMVFYSLGSQLYSI